MPGALADLLTDTASVTVEPERRLELMREALGIRLRQLRDPGGAVLLAIRGPAELLQGRQAAGPVEGLSGK